MGSKLILLLGLLVGIFLTLMCVNDNKTAILLKHQSKSKDNSLSKVTKQKADTRSSSIELPEPIFTYDLKDRPKLTLILSEKDKNSELEEFILTYCPSDKCTQDLTFDTNIKEASWQTDALRIAAFLKDKNVKNGYISINGKQFDIQGELQNDKDMEELNQLLTPFDPESFKMENLTTIVKQEMKTPPDKQKQNMKDIDEKIDILLKTNPIFFEFNSSDITKKSKDTLEQIIDILKDHNDISLIVEGHTDAGGNAKYNRYLSQKRADSVKKYLLEHSHITDIKSIGYGEERPISTNPRDKINRRVEIHIIKRGE